MFLRFEENDNCGFVDDRVFTRRSEVRVATHVRRPRGGDEIWCPVAGVDEKGRFGPASACKVEDSGDGICYLVFGGPWGLRLRDPSCEDAWSFADPHQWGEAFLLLPGSGDDVRFLDIKT